MRFTNGFAWFALAGAAFLACGEGTGLSPSHPLPSTTSSTGGTGTGGQGGAGGGGVGGAGGAGVGGGGSGQGGSTTSTTTSTTSGSGGSGGNCGSAADAVIEQQGQADKILLKGVIVTPDQVIDGELLIDGDTIACVAASCAAQAAGATVVQTNGIIFPGLIDTHNHILFDIFDETDWAPLQAYGDHDDWTNEARYKAVVDAKQYLNGEGSPADFGCEMDKYGELKGLIAGTTSIAGAANPGNKVCFGSLARTIDQTPNDLPSDDVQVATLFPTQASGDGVCNNFTNGNTHAYLVHVAEGVNQTALNEFGALGTVTTTDGCLYDAKTTIVHGTALGDAELTTMAQNGMKLTWSPASNVFLYGAGTDLTKTTNIPLALSKGINVALAPDWSMGGSQNLLDELRFADKVDNTVWGDILTPKMLTEMVTLNAARNLGLEAVLGSLEVGKRADVMVITGDTANPYDALLAATPGEVRLVIVDGVPLYGDDELQPLGPQSPGCESIGVCCATKFVCVAEAGGTAANKLGQTLAEITSTLETALGDYDAMDLTQWDFAPLTPLVRCP